MTPTLPPVVKILPIVFELNVADNPPDVIIIAPVLKAVVTIFVIVLFIP